jgi:hypothetical protein
MSCVEHIYDIVGLQVDGSGNMTIHMGPGADLTGLGGRNVNVYIYNYVVNGQSGSQLSKLNNLKTVVSAVDTQAHTVTVKTSLTAISNATHVSGNLFVGTVADSITSPHLTPLVPPHSHSTRSLWIYGGALLVLLILLFILIITLFMRKRK